MASETSSITQTHGSHLALVNEVSALVTAETSTERVFTTVIERIFEFFAFDAVALYTGSPLTLQLQYGGIPTPLGTPVPDGLAHFALCKGDSVTSAALGGSDFVSQVPWAPAGIRSEAAFPLLFHDQSFGVLNVFSDRNDALDHAAMSTLCVLVRWLAVAAKQGAWPNEASLSKEQARAFERLQEFVEFKDQILQNISHELRTPLTLAKGYVELMNAGQMGEISADQRQSLHIVLNKIDDIVAIIDRTVSLSSLNSFSLRYSRIPVAEWLREVLLHFETRAAATGITLDLEPVDAELCLQADREQLQQACANILDNSVKFSPSGGRVTVGATVEDAYLHLIFRDEGIGIPQQQLTQIFDTFYQVDGSTTRRFGGLGLGLAVVSRVVRAHKGKVWAESEVNRGSTIHMLLPIDSARPLLFGAR